MFVYHGDGAAACHSRTQGELSRIGTRPGDPPIDLKRVTLCNKLALPGLIPLHAYRLLYRRVGCSYYYNIFALAACHTTPPIVSLYVPSLSLLHHALAELIDPSDLRNDLYVTLDSGDFLSDHKTTGKNVEVSMSLFLDNGVMLKVTVPPT